MTVCKSCGAAIRFVRTISGQTMPIDPEPAPEGIVQIMSSGLARVIPTELRETIPPGAQRYNSHFATCPDAAAFREKVSKGKRGERGGTDGGA